MGTFAQVSAILAITCAWSFLSPPREKRRADTAVCVCIFLLAWIAAGVACLAQPPSLYSLIFK